jgi:hypothetical protein
MKMDADSSMLKEESEIIGLDKLEEHQCNFYDEVLAAARNLTHPFAIGGAMAWATYTGYYRNTKDLDLYVPPELKQDFIDAVTKVGATDYFGTLAYDRGWIYRSTRDGCIADLIWSMANYVRPIDEDYFTKGAQLGLRGHIYQVLPAEELILNKLYILNRGRCDWFDIFNLIYCTDAKLDWNRMIRKLEADKVLLAGLLNVFCWLCPARVTLFPNDLWEILGMERPSDNGPDIHLDRVRYLDSRPWFIPTLKPGEMPFTEIPVKDAD